MRKVVAAAVPLGVLALCACALTLPIDALRPAGDAGADASDASDAAMDAASDASDPCVVPGLVAYYRFDDSTPGLTRNCVPDGGLDVVLEQGATLVGGGFSGQALKILAPTGFARVDGTHPVFAQGPITVAAWVKVPNYATAGRILSNRGANDGGSGSSLDLTIERATGLGTDAGLGFYVSSGAPAYVTGPFPVDTWMHVVGVHRQDAMGSRSEVWLDGKLLKTVPENRELFTTPPRLGNDYRGTFGQQGLIDELRVYNRALESAEIEALARR